MDEIRSESVINHSNERSEEIEQASSELTKGYDQDESIRTATMGLQKRWVGDMKEVWYREILPLNHQHRTPSKSSNIAFVMCHRINSKQ